MANSMDEPEKKEEELTSIDTDTRVAIVCSKIRE